MDCLEVLDWEGGQEGTFALAYRIILGLSVLFAESIKFHILHGNLSINIHDFCRIVIVK